MHKVLNLKSSALYTRPKSVSLSSDFISYLLSTCAPGSNIVSGETSANSLPHLMQNLHFSTFSLPQFKQKANMT